MRLPLITASLAGLALLVVPVAGQAVYAVTPTQKAHRVVGSDTVAGDLFGNAVAVSRKTVVVGAVGKNHKAGAAYVFDKQPGGWYQQAELTASDARRHSGFGGAVAISGDTLVVGASNGFNGTATGAAYVYQRTGTTWTQTAELRDPTATAGDHFGYAVAVSGSTIVIGAYGAENRAGAAYVYHPTGTTWTESAGLLNPYPAGDQFGYSVAVSGSTIVVGVSGDYAFPGAAAVFTETGGSWSQSETLQDPVAENGLFGYVVTLDPAGHVLVISAPGETAAYVYGKVDGIWENTARLAGAEYSDFGESVAVTSDEILVGAPLQAAHAGAAFPFMLAAGTWNAQAEVDSPSPATDTEFGSAVGLIGHAALVGQPFYSHRKGVVYRITGDPL